MSRSLTIGDRQRAFRVDLRRLRAITRALLKELFDERWSDVGIWLVDAAEMTRLNETFLKHRGCTDVIAFDYSESAGEAPRRPTATARGPHPALHGEVCVCLEAAAAQARRFGTTWQCELARYVTHGLLHLRGFDDRRPADRRRMKREEARLLKGLGSRFELERLGARPDPPKSRARAGAARRNPPRPSARMPQ